MERVVSEFLHLLYDTEEWIKHSPPSRWSHSTANFLTDFREKRVTPLFRRLERIYANPYVLSIVGLTNVGKSTLAHALLGYPVAPSRNAPATPLPVEYEYAPQWSMKLFSYANQSVHNVIYPGAEELSQELQRLLFSATSIQLKTVQRISVHGPMEMLKDGLVFADTPGFGAAQATANDGSHAERLASYIKGHVHEVLFCVNGKSCKIGDEELHFFRAVQDYCSTIVVTKWECDPQKQDEMEQYKTMYAHLFPRCGFKFVEAKWAIKAANEDRARLDESQIEGLRDLIIQRASPQARVSLSGQQVLDAWNDLHALSRNPVGNMNPIPWRKDGLARFTTAAISAGVDLPISL